MIPATQGASRTQTIDSSNGAGATDTAQQSLLQEPNANAATSLMMLMVKMNKEERSEAASQELTAEKQEAAADADRVQQLHEKADAAFTSGILTGVIDIGSGAMSCASAVVSANGNAKDLAVKEDVANGALQEKSTAWVGRLGQVNAIKNWASAIDVASHATSVAKDFVGGTFQKIQGDHDADAAAAEASSHRSASQVNQAHEMKRQADDDRRFVLDWFKKLQDTTNETNNALARRA